MTGDNLNADILGGKKYGLKTLYKYESKDESKFDEIIPNKSFKEYNKIISTIKKFKLNIHCMELILTTSDN